jgi:hypothetical protein
VSEPIGIVRASSWGDLGDCAFRWYGKNILGVRSPTRPPMVVGSAVHRGTDTFDRAVLGGEKGSVDAAVETAAEYAKAPVREDGTPEEVDWGAADEERITPGTAVDYAVKLTAKYCITVAPVMQYSAIEVKCNALDVNTEHGVVRLTGTTDRVRVYPDKTQGISDFKSGGKAVEGVTSGRPHAVTRGHGLQLGAYTLMTEQETGQKLGAATIVGFQTSSKLHIAEGIVEKPKLAMVGTGEHPGMIEIAAQMLKSGLFPPNPKSILCSEKWCPMWNRCPYHG